jgi:phosphomethylpyrimidine synthase
MASRIAAHISDIAKNVGGAYEKDIMMAKFRKEFDWHGQVNVSIDPEKTEKLLEKSNSAKDEGCTMCGEFCAIKLGKSNSHKTAK